ncbi:MAG TPA: carboxylating nicotinate-nucleotide diphosphorylase [Saprospiraceae bacterium]|nr:carboxylating nicotinate-nucleotide diphosphorylase [Saprospiraceae bacterium]
MKNIPVAQLDGFIENALAEDIGGGDYTSMACIPANHISTAQLLVKDAGVIAGVQLAEIIFKKLDEDSIFESFIPDGQDVDYGDIVFKVTCNTRALLQSERLVLNIMQRMSGIAALSSRFHVEVEDMPVTILDTRKTTPLLRFLEKWAVRIGGCSNYRFGLYDRIMIKDNHIDACGSIGKAIEKAKEYNLKNNLNLEITVEVRNLIELYEVLDSAPIQRIMLDNFEIPIMSEAVAIVNKRVETEASGGVTIHNVRKIAKTGVDYISVGALTHSAGSLDLSLKVLKD